MNATYIIPADAVLTHGAHETRPGTCARELLHQIVTGEKADRTPECLTVTLSCLPVLNDMSNWRNDDHRTKVILEYFPRLLGCTRDAARDVVIARKLAEAAAWAMVRTTWDDARAATRAATRAEAALAQEVAAGAAREAAGAVEWATRAARTAAVAWAARAAEQAAAAAAWAMVRTAWDDARATERVTRIILEVICTECGQ